VSLAEMLFVFSHSQLTEVEKILWLTIASHADRDSFSCTISYAQLSHCIYQPHETVHRALKRLLALGFLENEGLLEAFTPLTLLRNCMFTVRLPLEGLLLLKRSSQTKKSETWHEKGIYKRPQVLINLLNDRFNS
jgi:hypothetical protein